MKAVVHGAGLFVNYYGDNMFDQQQIQQDFYDYLISTSKVNYHVAGQNDNGFFIRRKGYKHRWSTPYMRDLLRRLYVLKDWYIIQGNRPVTLVTLTTYQRGLSVPDQLVLLVEAWKKTIKLIRSKKPGIQYFRVLEHHDSGYGHFHVILFDILTKKEKRDIRRIYAEKYQAGSYKHGIDFQEGNKEIDHIIAYCLAYVKPEVTTSEGWWILQSNVWAMWHNPGYPKIRNISFSNGINEYFETERDHEHYDKVFCNGDTIHTGYRLVFEAGRQKKNDEIDEYHLPIKKQPTPILEGLRGYQECLLSLRL